MKLRGPLSPSRTPVYGKTVYVRVLRGQLLVCKWPRKRPRIHNPTTLEQMERFRQANWAAKYFPAAIQMAYRKMVEGTQLLPRDLIVAGLLGRGLSYTTSEERQRYPMAAIRDLSETLDILGGLPSDVLGRGPDLWQAVRPAQAGQMLVSGAPGDAPNWQTLSPGSGVWQQLQDKTLASDLGIDVYEEVVIPAGVNKIEFDLLAPAAAFSINPRMNVNGLTTSIYNAQVAYGSSGTTIVATSSLNGSAFGFFHSSQFAVNRAMMVFGQILLRASGSLLMVKGSGVTGVPRTAEMTGFATLPAGESITKIGFQSNVGSGLPAGTRIVVRGALP